MALRVSGKNLDIGEALRERVEARVAEALAKYFDGGFGGRITVEKEGSGFRAECYIHLDSGIDLQSQGVAQDAYASCDQAAIRIEKRLRRYKRRIRDHHTGRNGAALGAPEQAASYVIAAPAEDDEGEVNGVNPVIIAESSVKLRRLSVSDAVLQLDLTDAPVVVFRHGGHGRVNVVYRRSDGNIGWIDPPPASDDQR